MSKIRILLMYITQNSGHHHASLAIEHALKELSDDVEVKNINSFLYTNPVLEKIITTTYMSVIKRRPEVWGYLYDNPKVIQRTRYIKAMMHKYNSAKMKNLLSEFNPRAVICTQAFPCGIIADCKDACGKNLFLSGVLTDYAPHSYWLYDTVDMYFVPSEETKAKLVAQGISDKKIAATGIPIDSKFKKIIDKRKILYSLGFSQDKPVVLVMGGSQGVGPIKEMLKVLDATRTDFQIIAVAGGNKKLLRYMNSYATKMRKKIKVLGYTENVDELMDVSSLIITKPGGITISESLAKGLPLIIIKPIPGHEMMNTKYLVSNKLAIKVDRIQDAGLFVEELLSKPETLLNMQKRAKAFAHPNSAMDIARIVLEKVIR